MAESEIGARFFSAMIRKPSLASAVADVATYKGAEAVFAPAGSQKGLNLVFSGGAVPNPAFVQLNTSLPKATVSKVQAAVLGFSVSGAISGWAGGRMGIYTSLAGRMGGRTYKGIFAQPTAVRVNVGDILIQPNTLDDTNLTSVDQHFANPPARQE
jgi:hypothetical protein